MNRTSASLCIKAGSRSIANAWPKSIRHFYALIARMVSVFIGAIQYLVTFTVMLVTALTTTHFTSILRQRAQEAVRRELQTEALYQLAKQLAGSLTIQQVVEITNGFVRSQLAATSGALLPGAAQKTLVELAAQSSFPIEVHLAHVAFESGKFVRSDEVRGMGYASLYFPLKAPMWIRGVLAVAFDEQSGEPNDESLFLLDALASLIAVALERLHYVEVAPDILSHVASRKVLGHEGMRCHRSASIHQSGLQARLQAAVRGVAGDIVRF